MSKHTRKNQIYIHADNNRPELDKKFKYFENIFIRVRL